MSKQKHIAIKASKKSISSMILSILMLLSVIPLHSSTIFAESTKKTVMNGTGNIQKTDSIWFGIRGKDLTGAGSEIQWRVLDTNTNIGEDGIFLLSEKLIGKSDFSKGWKASRKWQGSDAQKWCKDFSGENGDNSLKSLSDQELAAIKPTTESNPGKIAPDVPFHPKEKYALKEDKVFFPSVGEAGKYFQTDDERIAYDGNNPEKWWLRSPHKSLIQNVRIVKQNGGISYSNVKSKLATRPAFNLDTTKVLFTSPAVDGKQSNAAGDALKAVEDTDTTEWKLTLIDRNRTFQLDTDNGEKVTIAGNILTIPYKDATTGTNEYISAVVEKGGSITHYGNVLEVSAGKESGTVTVQLPDNFDKTTDTLYLINEQLNGDKKTDYSSEKVEVKIPEEQPQQPTEYTVTMENDGHGTATLDGSTEEIKQASPGTTVTIKAAANNGFRFKKWQVLKGVPGNSGQVHFDEGAENTAFIMPESDVTIKAIFGKLYQIDVKPNNPEYGTALAKVGKVGGVETTAEIAGTEIILEATPNSVSGYKFDKWEVTTKEGVKVEPDNANSTTTTFIMPDEDVEVKAIFVQDQPPQPQPQEYTVTVKSNNTTMGKVAPDKVEHVAKDTVIVENGNKLTINGKEVIATADPGYKFNNWTGIPQGKKVVADVEITANFERENQPPQPTKYKVQLTNDGNGTATASSSQAEQGKKVTITAMPDRGYKFDEWRVLSGGIRLRDKDSATTTFTMPNRDVEIKAYFKKKSSEGSSHDAEYYNITTKTDKHGTVEARSKAREGTEVSVIVDPDKGYKLDEITVTDRRGRDITIKETNRENRYKFTMPARDVTVEATFKQIKQEQPSKPTTPPTIPPTNNNKPTENNIIKKQQTTVFTIGSNIMTVITDGKATQTTIDAKPFLSQGRVMIPVRYAAESLGMQVEWNKQTQTVVLKDRENTVMIPIKTNKIIVGNQEYTSDVTPILKNGRTYLTISNIAKALRMRAGQDVKWDNKIKQVTIIKEVEVR
ncbi:InlB B-repeat-containing protein [Filifactor alocis]|uniref:InlB B-repeat-containing protein n=1 Tax=Filifactor alocis TaxID=143361 RepID=UPI003C6F481E